MSRHLLWGSISALVAVLALVSPPPAAAYQSGANPDSSVGSFGVHSRIHQPAVTFNGADPRVYNVATTLGDGTFIQVGYVDLANFFIECSHTGLAPFVTVLYPNGSHLLNLYNIDQNQCNLSGTHWFTIVRTQATPVVIWTVKMDGVAFGPTYLTDSSGGWMWTKNGGLFSEYVHSYPPPPGASMATTEYGTALEHLLASDGLWHGVGHAHYVGDAPCPPNFVHVIASNDIQTKQSASTTECRSTGASLW